jgi:uncharacterized protein
MPKTALQMTREEWKKYRPRARIKETALISSSSTSHSRDEALKVAKQAAELLRQRFKAKKVVVFGSTATTIGFSEFSDIDIAAWGIHFDEYYRAVAAVNGLNSRFKVDLIDPESCLESLKKTILEQGVVI